MLCTVTDVVDATRTAASPDGGTLAGTVVLRSCDLQVRGDRTVVAAGAVPLAGELAVFCRPVMTAPAAVVSTVKRGTPTPLRNWIVQLRKERKLGSR